MTMNGFEGTHYIAMALCSLCGAVLTILSVHRICLSWNDQWLIQRNRYLVLLLVFCCAVYLLINVPHTTACALVFGNEPFLWPFEQHIVATLLQNMSVYGAIIGYVGKVFSLYFKHGYEKALSTKALVRKGSFELFGADWFIPRKHTLGNQWYILSRLIILWITSIVFIETLFILQWFGLRRLGLLGMVNLFSVIVAICIGIRMWRTFPATHDAFHIQDNILFTMRWQAFVQIFAIPIGIIRIFQTELWLTLGVVAAIAFCLFEYCLVLHPFQMMTHRTVREPLSSLMRSNWREVIENRDGFDAFMHFLQSRFASESFLFVCEFIQFKNVLTAHNLLDVDRLENEDEVVELPDDLPLSSAMAELSNKLKGTRNWKIQFWKTIRAMHARYLTGGAEMELNIDYNLKRRMNELVNDKRDSDHRKASVMRTLQVIYKEICSKMLDGAFVDFNGSDVAEAYYKKQKVKERTFIPQVNIPIMSNAIALWNTEGTAPSRNGNTVNQSKLL